MGRILTIPNGMSVMRILMIPPLFFLITHSSRQNYPILISVYFFTIMLDFFDGFLARKLSQESELGKILDPLADKLLMLFLIIAFMISAKFPVYLAVTLFLRDFSILVGSVFIYKRKHDIKQSIFIGKVTFGGLSILLLIFVIDLHPGIDLFLVKRFFSVLCFGFVLWSFQEYYKIYRSIK